MEKKYKLNTTVNKYNVGDEVTEKEISEFLNIKQCIECGWLIPLTEPSIVPERIKVGKMCCIVGGEGYGEMKWDLRFKTNKYIHYDKSVELCNLLERYFNGEMDNPAPLQQVQEDKPFVDEHYWEQELHKCKINPYYFYTKYMTVNGKPCTTRLSEQDFNDYFFKVIPDYPQPSPTVQDKQEWEIVSYLFNDVCYSKAKSGLYISPTNDALIAGNLKDSKIKSVRRLSDNTVWQVKQNTNKGVINFIKIEDGKLYFDCGEGINRGAWSIRCLCLPTPNTDTITTNAQPMETWKGDVVSSKPVLFTTEDGVEIKEGDDYFFIDAGWDIRATAENYNWVGSIKAISFSTKSAAELYILKNKPCLSFNEIMQSVSQRIGNYDQEQLKKAIQEKINK